MAVVHAPEYLVVDVGRIGILPVGAFAQEAEYPIDERSVEWSDVPIEFLAPEAGTVLGLRNEDFCRWVAFNLGVEVSADDLTLCAEGIAEPETALVPESMLPVIVAAGATEADAPAEAAPAAPEAKPKEKAAKKPKPVPHKKLSKRGWQRVVKAPDRYDGKKYILWACITQFDAATGEDTFRGDASYKNWKRDFWYQGDNALFTGNAKKLDRYVQDDLVWMKVDSWGSFSYDTQIGGNTTVPIFWVDQIKRVGSC